MGLFGGLLGVACSGQGDRPPGFGAGGEGGTGSGVVVGPCREGDQRECGYKVDQGVGVVTCYRGVQSCVDGFWSDCRDGEFVEQPDPKVDRYKGFFRKFAPQAVAGGTPGPCSPADVCDPYCYESANGTPTFTPGISNDTGPGLCVESTPSACSPTTATGTKCAHDLCTAGGALTNGCDTCVTKVCAAKPACCTTAWDSTCVAEAYAQCLNSPPPVGLCDFGVYSKTTILTANGPSFGTNATIGGLGNLIIDTDAANAFPIRVLTPCNIWIKNANIAGPIPVTGGIWAGGSAIFDAGSATVWQAEMHLGRGLYMNSNNTITGKVYASGNFNLASGTPAGCTGPSGWPPSTTSTSYNISGQGGTVINGSAYAAGTMDTSPTVNPAANKFVSQGTTVVPPPTVSLPSAAPLPTTTTCSGLTSFPASTGTCTVSGMSPNQTLAINGGVCTLPGPGNYQNVTMQNGAKLVLNGAGTYTFKSISSTATDGGIQIGSPTNTTGNYTVTVCGKLSLGNNQNIIDSTASVAAANNKTPVLSPPTRLAMYVLGADTATPCTGTACAVSFGVDTLYAGILSVPNGTFHAQNNNTTSTSFNGAVWANAFNVGTKFNLSQISKAACESMNLPGTGPSATTCPWDNTTTVTVPAIQKSEVQPCRSGLDCQINQRCVKVTTASVPATCAHDKCATGPGLSAACRTADACVDRICAFNSTCCTSGASNWSTTCVNLVATQCDASCDGPAGSSSGECVSNSGRVNGCATFPTAPATATTNYELAVDYVCQTSSIPVCNHSGTANFSGAVTVGYWNINKRKFADVAPGTPDGSCTQTLTIPPGSCTNMTSCSSGSLPASGTTYTFMVDPSSALSECGGGAGNAGRRLDNWSWHDSTYTCANTPDYVEYDYQAACPDDSIAVWKNLTWVTTVPTGSEVRFYGKTGKTTAALDAGSFTTLGTAKLGPPNTTRCSLDPADMGSSSCVVGLTSTLGLTKPQDQRLRLRIELGKSGGTPTVTKWEVSYSCQFDQ